MPARDDSAPSDGPDSREEARMRRRDRDANAAARDLMRPGMGKVFKQIQDRQAKVARAATAAPKRRDGPRREARETPPD